MRRWIVGRLRRSVCAKWGHVQAIYSFSGDNRLFTPAHASAYEFEGIPILPKVFDPPYNRGLYKHWIDADGDSEDTRQEVLIEESLTPAIVRTKANGKRKVIEAREFVKGLILGEVVFLEHIKHRKYAGRVVADVKLDTGDNLAEKIISQGLGREYHGGAREGWCQVDH